MCGGSAYIIVSVPERSKGVDSSSTVFALVGSNPTADMTTPLTGTSVPFCAASARSRVCTGLFTFLLSLSLHSSITSTHGPRCEMDDTRFTRLLHAFTITEPSSGSNTHTTLVQDCSRC